MTLTGHAMRGASGKETDGTNAPFFDGSQVCSQVDPELFFPENKLDERAKIRITRPLCNSCEFKNPCLEYALANPEVQGTWGGYTESERARMRRIKRVV